MLVPYTIFQLLFGLFPFPLLVTISMSLKLDFPQMIQMMGKKVLCLWFVFLTWCFLVLSSSLLLPAPFRAKSSAQVLLVALFCIFSLSQLLWLFSLRSPHSRWHFLASTHVFLSASAPIILAIYGCFSRCGNCPLLDISQIWMQCWMNSYFD